MGGKYFSYEDSAEIVCWTRYYARRVGILWPATRAEACIALASVLWTALVTVQLFYSVSQFAGDYDSIIMIVFHAATTGCTPLGTICLLPSLRASVVHSLTEPSFSYDYGGEVMPPIQEELRKKKNKKFMFIVKLIPVLTVVLTLNQAAATIADKYLFGGTKYLSPTPIWYPSFLDRDNLWVEICLYISILMSLFVSSRTISCNMGLIFTIYNHLTSELTLFSVGMALTEERARDIADKEGVGLDEAYRRAVGSSAHHHTLITGYFDKIQPLTKVQYGLNYGLGLVFWLCSGFAITSESQLLKVKFTIITVLLLNCLFWISWCAEVIAESANTANEAVYAVDFLSLPADTRSTLRILLLGSQRPLIMKTFLGQQIHLEGYMELLKAGYSYLNMMLLLTRGDEL